MSPTTRRLSLAVGVTIVASCAAGGAPPEFVAFALWSIVDSRLQYLCEIRARHWHKVQRIGYTAMMIVARTVL